MGEVIREEKERLKTALIKKDYNSLQLRFFDIVKQDHQVENLDHHDLKNPSMVNSSPNNLQNQSEEVELVSLSLGRITSNGQYRAKNLPTEQKNINYDHQDLKANDLSLGLGSETKISTEIIASDESAENSSEYQAKELTEFPKKNSNMRNNDNGDHNDEVSHEQSQPAKRARVCVRARCDTPTVSTKNIYKLLNMIQYLSLVLISFYFISLIFSS